jgi:hypothetical protein
MEDLSETIMTMMNDAKIPQTLSYRPCRRNSYYRRRYNDYGDYYNYY